MYFHDGLLLQMNDLAEGLLWVDYQGYFAGMYYVLILLMATDKFKVYISKESKDRKRYYARYEERSEDEN